MSQMKEQYKTPEKQLSEVNRQPNGKRIQINDSEDHQGSWKKNGGKD